AAAPRPEDDFLEEEPAFLEEEPPLLRDEPPFFEAWPPFLAAAFFAGEAFLPADDMPRLSRPHNLPRWIVIVAAIFFIAFEAFAIYLFVLDRRLTRELVDHSWSAPTIIATAAGGSVREVARLYGADWRITPLVTVKSLPRYVSDAFIAAEDVRFHHHLGV